jgi:hypothetical protein
MATLQAAARLLASVQMHPQAHPLVVFAAALFHYPAQDWDYSALAVWPDSACRQTTVDPDSYWIHASLYYPEARSRVPHP